jgi:hypothetical protein
MLQKSFKNKYIPQKPCWSIKQAYFPPIFISHFQHAAWHCCPKLLYSHGQLNLSFGPFIISSQPQVRYGPPQQLQDGVLDPGTARHPLLDVGPPPFVDGANLLNLVQ